MFKYEVRDRLRGKPHLLPVMSHSLDIPARLRREVDPSLFVVFNTIKQKYEVHSLDNEGNTFGFSVPLNELDARTIKIARKHDIRTRGKKIFEEMDKHNEQVERSNERQRSNDIRGIAEEIRPAVKKLAWEGY